MGRDVLILLVVSKGILALTVMLIGPLYCHFTSFGWPVEMEINAVSLHGI
jgi:hypothetical protein